MATEEFLLTTVDNPFNPFTEFDEWLSFDTQKGYNTCGYLARIVKSSHQLSETDEALAIDLAIEEILKENIYGVHRKVSSKDFESKETTVET